MFYRTHEILTSLVAEVENAPHFTRPNLFTFYNYYYYYFFPHFSVRKEFYYEEKERVTLYCGVREAGRDSLTNALSSLFKW